MIGHLKEMTRSRGGEWIVSFSTSEDFRERFDDLVGKDVSIEIKKAGRRRSADANAYAWALIDQIAEKTGVKTTDVYRNAIREIGGISTCVGLKDTVIDAFRQSWEAGHLGRQVEIVGHSSKEGWSNVRIYFGSSEFDSAQMARLIDSLIQDAEALGIPTITEEQAQTMLGKWGKK